MRWDWLLLLVAALAAGAAGLSRLPYRQRGCPNCGTPMVRPEQPTDELYLDSGRDPAEVLQAVDYAVWQCPVCGYHDLHSRRRWLARFKSCPQCRYRTLTVRVRTLERPTDISTGRERITRDCRHCRYHDEETVILPVLTRSDDNGADGNW